MQKTPFLAAILILTLFSCSRPVEIYFPSFYVTQNEVILNDKINLAEYAGVNTYSKVSVNNGDVTISINGRKESFHTENGGVLNLAAQKFVIFPYYYNEKPGQMQGTEGMPGPIIVDSVLFYHEAILGSFGTEKLIELAMNADSDPYDPERAKNIELTKVQPSDFFIEKVWEIGLNSPVPSKYPDDNPDANYASRVGIKAIGTEDRFFNYAMSSPSFDKIFLRQLSQEQASNTDSL